MVAPEADGIPTEVMPPIMLGSKVVPQLNWVQLVASPLTGVEMAGLVAGEPAVWHTAAAAAAEGIQAVELELTRAVEEEEAPITLEPTNSMKAR